VAYGGADGGTSSLKEELIFAIQEEKIPRDVQLRNNLRQRSTAGREEVSMRRRRWRGGDSYCSHAGNRQQREGE
jgi:hypothetical protein